MIIDTSALVAAAWREDGFEIIVDTILEGGGYLPTPVILEFHRVTALAGNLADPIAVGLLKELVEAGNPIVALDMESAEAAVAANPVYGSGNGRNGPLNFVDLMVYGVAKARAMPILCTGRDFSRTDAAIHPASRVAH